MITYKSLMYRNYQEWVFLKNFWEWFFQLFVGKKKFLASALKSYINGFYNFFLLLKKFEKIDKIGYHSNLNFEWNTERGFKESLSIALGWDLIKMFLKLKSANWQSVPSIAQEVLALILLLRLCIAIHAYGLNGKKIGNVHAKTSWLSSMHIYVL